MKLQENYCKLKTLDVELDAKTNEILCCLAFRERVHQVSFVQVCWIKLGWSIWLLLLLILFGSLKKRGYINVAQPGGKFSGHFSCLGVTSTF